MDAKKNKGQVPNVITQTWAERSQNEKNEVSSELQVDRDFFFPRVTFIILTFLSLSPLFLHTQ